MASISQEFAYEILSPDVHIKKRLRVWTGDLIAGEEEC